MAVIVAVLVGCAVIAGCGPAPNARLTARPAAAGKPLDAGSHPLRLGGWTRRDGTLYVPKIDDVKSRALLVLLHGGGGKADDFRHVFPIAEELGVVLLTIDSRDNTWDGVDSAFGPDVRFIDRALQHTFERVPIDPQRVGIGGLSDGGFYAISLGIMNGDLFTHIIAVAPGRYTTVAPPVGHPRILVAHGTRDNVYPTFLSRSVVVPKLTAAGYDVTYREFDGPHFLPSSMAREVIEWFMR